MKRKSGNILMYVLFLAGFCAQGQMLFAYPDPADYSGICKYHAQKDLPALEQLTKTSEEEIDFLRVIYRDWI